MRFLFDENFPRSAFSMVADFGHLAFDIKEFDVKNKVFEPRDRTYVVYDSNSL